MRSLFLILVLCSCSSFKSRQSLTQIEPQKLLDAVRVTGEGRGRLSFGESQSQYVFGVESLLNDQFDWIIAISVPLQGEEVMIFPDLKQKNIENDQFDSLEDRIQKELKKLKLPISGNDFLKELRSLIRFHLAPSLGISRVCKVRQEQGECSFDGETFYLEVMEKEFTIKKLAIHGSFLELRAQNLTDSFFHKTQISLYTETRDQDQKEADFSLELFW